MNSHREEIAWKIVQGKIGRDEEKSLWSLTLFPDGCTITGILTVERKLKHYQAAS